MSNDMVVMPAARREIEEIRASYELSVPIEKRAYQIQQLNKARVIAQVHGLNELGCDLARTCMEIKRLIAPPPQPKGRPRKDASDNATTGSPFFSKGQIQRQRALKQVSAPVFDQVFEAAKKEGTIPSEKDVLQAWREHVSTVEDLDAEDAGEGPKQRHFQAADPEKRHDEWYTPRGIVENVWNLYNRLGNRTPDQVFGQIDLDPASCAVANKTVQAREFWTREQDGLSREWFGHVWLNPPYSAKDAWISKCSEEMEAHRTQAICLLLNASTETVWAQRALRASTAVCFLAQRVRFHGPDAPKGGSPMIGQMLLFYGDGIGHFRSIFSSFGTVMVPCTP